MIKWLKNLLARKSKTPHTDAAVSRQQAPTVMTDAGESGTSLVDPTDPFYKRYPDTIRGLDSRVPPFRPDASDVVGERLRAELDRRESAALPPQPTAGSYRQAHQALGNIGQLKD